MPRKLPSGTAGLAVRWAGPRPRSRHSRWIEVEADRAVGPERDLQQLLLPVALRHDKEDTFAGTVSDRTHRVRRSILNLEQLSDIALYETLSEGMPLIVDNATNLDDTARRLYRDEEYRASEVMRGFAEEEAAKVLILIDYVRCPRSWEQRAQVLKRFYGHVAKRIHAMACDFPRIASFKELSSLVEGECRPWYLDGPNGIDWIFCELDFGETRTRPLCRLCAGRDRRRGRVPLDRSCSSHPFPFAISAIGLRHAGSVPLGGGCPFGQRPR